MANCGADEVGVDDFVPTDTHSTGDNGLVDSPDLDVTLADSGQGDAPSSVDSLLLPDSAAPDAGPNDVGCASPADCDDGNACTNDACHPAKGCQHVAVLLSTCDDGDPCTGADACQDGKCVGDAAKSTLNCDDSNPCTDDSCAAGKGCSNTNNTKPCDDGNGCTSQETCLDGKCALGPLDGKLCECFEDAHCKGFEDGKFCNGTLVCDGQTHKCAVDPATVKSAACDLAQAVTCHDVVCTELADGATCTDVNLPAGATCSDGDVCTTGDGCVSGSCKGAGKQGCDDGQVCTDDSCDPIKGCVFAANTAGCDDSQVCTEKDACAGGLCKGMVQKDCDDKEVCTVDLCVSGKGCVHLANAEKCDDGDACTVGDGCAQGKCVAGAAAKCDDGNVCTDDGCDKAAGCTHGANSGPCSDGDACTDKDVCTSASCNAGAASACDDGNPCTDDGCNSDSGCTTKENGKPCDDGNPCTEKDICAKTTCTSGAPRAWVRLLGGAADDYGRSLLQLKEGGFTVAGRTSSSDLPQGQKAAGDFDAWVTRTDAAGTLMWNSAMGGTKWDATNAMVQLPDGGFALAGETESSDLPQGQMTKGGSDFWLVRLDKDGALVWNRTYGGGGTERAFGLSTLVDGGFVLAGWTDSTNLPGGSKKSNDYDLWFVRTDKNGGVTAHHAYGGTDNDHGRFVVQVEDGGFVLAGHASSVDLPQGQKSAGGYDFWLLRSDKDGNLLWNRTFGGSGNDWFRALAQVADGGFALAGETFSPTLPQGQKTAGGADFWLVRTDKNGSLLWNRTYGGKGDDIAYSVTALAEGGFMLAGQTNSTDLPQGQKTAGANDAWLVRTDKQGNLLWNRTAGGVANDDAFSPVALTDGGFVFTGGSSSVNLPQGPKNHGKSDLWLLRSDAWGNLDCEVAGLCALKGLADCDDGNPCTADLCDAAHKGCWHGPVEDGLTCLDGASCLNSGACQSGKCLAKPNAACTAVKAIESCDAGSLSACQIAFDGQWNRTCKQIRDKYEEANALLPAQPHKYRVTYTYAPPAAIPPMWQTTPWTSLPPSLIDCGGMSNSTGFPTTATWDYAWSETAAVQSFKPPAATSFDLTVWGGTGGGPAGAAGLGGKTSGRLQVAQASDTLELIYGGRGGSNSSGLPGSGGGGGGAGVQAGVGQKGQSNGGSGGGGAGGSAGGVGGGHGSGTGGDPGVGWGSAGGSGGGGGCGGGGGYGPGGGGGATAIVLNSKLILMAGGGGGGINTSGVVWKGGAGGGGNSAGGSGGGVAGGPGGANGLGGNRVDNGPGNGGSGGSSGGGGSGMYSAGGGGGHGGGAGGGGNWTGGTPDAYGSAGGGGGGYLDAMLKDMGSQSGVHNGDPKVRVVMH